MNLFDWIDSARHRHLTIRDIEDMKMGDQVDLLFFDRNLTDLVPDGKIPTNPEEFFKNAYRGRYTHKFGLFGSFEWLINGIIKEPIYDWEFHVEYKTDQWYPFKNGQLPINDWQGLADFQYDKPKSYRNFPRDTRLQKFIY